MGRIDRTAELIGKPGLPTPQGEVRSLMGSCRPRPRASSGVGVSRAPLEYFRHPQLGPSMGVLVLGRENAGEVLIRRPVSAVDLSHVEVRMAR